MMTTCNPLELEFEYYRDLERFVCLCQKLISASQPYMVVLLSHELYRFLYPVDRYAHVEHDDPVPFLLAHIKRLIAFGESSLDAVHGYSTPKVPWQVQSPPAESPVEQSTSDLYSELWLGYDADVLTAESRQLIGRRIPQSVIDRQILGRTVLDLGCGSGRYSIALAFLGARAVTGVDYQNKSYRRAEAYCAEQHLPVHFQEANVLELPFDDGAFDFVFCNGVLHHTRSWREGLAEYIRVMRRSGFLFLYATGGFFWTTRDALRKVFARIPQDYAASVLRGIGMPSNRMVFMDTWYVPIEEHIARAELEAEFVRHRIEFEKLSSQVETDLDHGLASQIPGASIVWGEGEHRYLVARQNR
jgi:ubiquinone/menaquinone biosynthesis C-methylase UbiE